MTIQDLIAEHDRRQARRSAFADAAFAITLVLACTAAWALWPIVMAAVWSLP